MEKPTAVSALPETKQSQKGGRKCLYIYFYYSMAYSHNSVLTPDNLHDNQNLHPNSFKWFFKYIFPGQKVAISDWVGDQKTSVFILNF